MAAEAVEIPISPVTQQTSAYIPTVENDCSIRVTRFDLDFPKEDPNSYVIGFTVTCLKNARSIYKDIQVLHETERREDENTMLTTAWNKLKASFQSWLDSIYDKPHIIGSFFTPQP